MILKTWKKIEVVNIPEAECCRVLSLCEPPQANASSEYPLALASYGEKP